MLTASSWGLHRDSFFSAGNGLTHRCTLPRGSQLPIIDWCLDNKSLAQLPQFSPALRSSPGISAFRSIGHVLRVTAAQVSFFLVFFSVFFFQKNYPVNLLHVTDCFSTCFSRAPFKTSRKELWYYWKWVLDCRL